MQEMGQPNQVVVQEPRELAVIHEDQGPDVSQEQNVQRKVSMTTRVVKAVFLFWLDIVLLICFVPRKSRVNLRTVLLVLTRTLLYAAILVAQYGVWELLQVDRGVSQPTEFTNYLEEILGLPTNCARGKRSINGWEELLDNMRLQEGENLEEQELQEKTTEVPIMNTTEIFAVFPANNTVSNATKELAKPNLLAAGVNGLLNFTKTDVEALSYFFAFGVLLMLLISIIIIIILACNYSHRNQEDREKKKALDVELMKVAEQEEEAATEL